MSLSHPMVDIDKVSYEYATSRFGLPPCLYFPAAVRDLADVERFVGRSTPIMRGHQMALLVEVEEPTDIDRSLIVWDMLGSVHLHRRHQVWVHVNYRGYRNAYKRAFPTEDVSGYDIDHILGREAARLWGFQYIRVVPVERSANRSDGFSYAIMMESIRSPERLQWRAEHPMAVYYANVGDIAKMMGVSVGNELHQGLNDFQHRLDNERRPGHSK